MDTHVEITSSLKYKQKNLKNSFHSLLVYQIRRLTIVEDTHFEVINICTFSS